MFPNVDNKSGLKIVQEALFYNNLDLYSSYCIVDALETWVTCNNSKFSQQRFLQANATAQELHMPCSYYEIGIAKCDSLTNNFHLTPSVWNRFRDDIFVLWKISILSLTLFLGYLNSMDKTGKINFTSKISSYTGLEFLDSKFKIVEGKIRVVTFGKITNNFRYSRLNNCYPKKNTYITYLKAHPLGVEESVMRMRMMMMIMM